MKAISLDRTCTDSINWPLLCACSPRIHMVQTRKSSFSVVKIKVTSSSTANSTLFFIKVPYCTPSLSFIWLMFLRIYFAKNFFFQYILFFFNTSHNFLNIGLYQTVEMSRNSYTYFAILFHCPSYYDQNLLIHFCPNITSVTKYGTLRLRPF